jgi:hypothetical protein
MTAEYSASSAFNEREIDKILATGWEAAVLENPMRLAVRPGDGLQQLRGMVRDCLAKEISAPVICQHIVRKLLASDRPGKPQP